MIAAVIFDLDGVLIDSEGAWDEARRALVDEQDGTWTETATRDMQGMSSLEWSRYLHNELGVPLEPAEISNRHLEYAGTWYGILTQAKVPRDIVNRLNAAINAALRAEDLKKLLIAQGSNPQPLSVEEFARFVQTDCPNWARAVKIAGLKPE